MQSDPIVRAVGNLIKFRGGRIPMTVTHQGEYDISTSSVDVTTSQYTPLALVLDAKESLATGSLIKTGDKQVFIKPDPDIPAPDATNTEFTIQGQLWKVYLVKEINPSGTLPIYFEVYARR